MKGKVCVKCVCVGGGTGAIDVCHTVFSGLASAACCMVSTESWLQTVITPGTGSTPANKGTSF